MSFSVQCPNCGIWYPSVSSNTTAVDVPEHDCVDAQRTRAMKRADEAEAKIAELEAENTALKKQMEIGVPDEKLEKRIVKLEEGLQEYGRHKSGCGYFDPEVLDCTCGLSALKEST